MVGKNVEEGYQQPSGQGSQLSGYICIEGLTYSLVCVHVDNGGKAGIRTLGTASGTSVFETDPFSQLGHLSDRNSIIA